MIGGGQTPSGAPWTVTASIKNNGSCDNWLFGLNFDLGEFGSVGTATGIPAGGHVPPEYFVLDAVDHLNEAHTEGVLSGYTGREGAKLIGMLKSGERFSLRPQFPPLSLRKKVAWLRSFRFFVYFHPTKSPIKRLSVYTRGGRLIYRAEPSEGEFF